MAVAFGSVKGTLTGGATSITNPAVASGSVAIAIGDLIVAVMAEQTTNSTTACGDNLHGASTYTAQNAGTDAGTITGRMFYKIVTTAGTLTAVNFVATASADNFAAGAVVFAGPFTTPPIDKNPANLSNDTTTPFSCPATGALTQADELIVGYICGDGDEVNAIAVSAPGVNRLTSTDAATGVIGNIIQSWVVHSTATVTPAFTGTMVVNNVLGTATFKQLFTWDDQMAVDPSDRINLFRWEMVGY